MSHGGTEPRSAPVGMAGGVAASVLRALDGFGGSDAGRGGER